MSGAFGKIKDVMDAGQRAQEARHAPVRVAIQLCDGCPRSLALALKGAFVPFGTGGLVHVDRVRSGQAVTVNPEADVAVVLCGGDGARAGSVAAAWQGAGVPAALVAESACDLPAQMPEGVVSVVAVDPERCLDLLAAWLAGAVRNPIALAASFSFCRPRVAWNKTLQCAAANAGVGAVDLVHGADFPVMFATEARLYSDIAAAYGRPSGPQQIPGFLAIAGFGLALRGVARRACGWAPAGAWAVRGALGGLGTLAVGKALQLRFEKGDDFDAQGERLWHVATELWERTVQKVQAWGGALVEVEPGAVYQEPPARSQVPVAAEDVVPVATPSRGWFTVADGRAR